MVFQLNRKKMRIITAFSSLLVFTMMTWTVNARVINKRAAFYIANETMCIVDGELYFNGDPVPTDDHCEKCTCRPPGFSCVLRDCEVKPGCKAVRKDGECCPDYICGCSHNGHVYKDGDFIRDLQNPCYTCRCHGSSISCTFADCLFRSDCGPEYVQGECCPRYHHCPSLSTTQKSTTVITTVPITYDETTKPLFNLTSPPHERLATHTTIFPTTGMITVESGETHTTETYEKPAVSDVSTEATHTTSGHDFTVTPSSESSTSHITHADTSTVTTSGSKTVTETLSEVDEDSSQKLVSLADETTTTESFSGGTTFLATDVKTVSEAKELISTSITPELSSEDDLMSQDGQVTEVSHDRQTEDSLAEALSDIPTDESVTELPHDNRVDDLETEVPRSDEEDDSEVGLSSSHTAESVTEESHDKQTDGLVGDLPHDSKSNHTSLESDEKQSTSDDTKGDENKDTSQSVDDTVESTTEMHTRHEEVKVSSEDEVPGSYEAFSNQPEVVEGSEGTSPSLVNTLTMSGDTDTELSPVKGYTIAEIDDITTHDTHSSVSDTSSTEVQETTTQGIHEEVADTLLSVVSSDDDHQTESDVEDKTTFSGHESDFGDSESSTIQSEIKLHSSITESTDVDDSSDEVSTNKGEISTQDAEEMNLFTVAVTPSGGSQQSQTTVLAHISNLPFSEVTNIQTVTSELNEEQSVDDSKVIENSLQTEEMGSIDSNISDLSSFVNSFTHVEGTTTAQSSEVPNSLQHTHFEPHSRETTTAQSVYTSSDIQNEPIGDVNNNDVNKLLSSVVTEDVTERHSDTLQSTTENLPEQENAEIAGTVQSSSDDHEAPHLLSEGVNALPPTDGFKTESEQIHAETEGSSQSPVAETTEDTAENVITMEAESDLSLSISEDSSTTSGGEDVSIASSRATEPSESLSVVSELITSTRAAETPVTVTSFPVISSTGETTTEHVVHDDVTSKPKEHEILSENFHITSTVLTEQETSDFDENSEIALSTTEIPSDDLVHHSEQLAEVSSIISEGIDHVDSESGTSTASDNDPERTETTSSPEESNDGSRNGVSLTTKSTTTKSLESPTTSPKQGTEELKPTEVYDDDENTARSAHFIKTDEQHDTQKDTTLVNELTTDSQQNTGSHITENTSEITMDAEESIVNNGFESIADYLYTTENYGENFISTRQGHSSEDKEEGDTQSHYTVDSETYSAINGEHVRVSRSTSSNNMASSITAQYPEKIELKTLHVLENENETREASTTNEISVSSFDNTAVAGDENKSVTESLHTETTQTAPTTVQDNSVKSTHSIYLNSVEVSSLSSDPPNENLHTSPNTDDSYVSQVTKLISDEDQSPDGVDAELSVEETEETSEDVPNGGVSLASTVEVLLSAEPTTGLFKDNNIAPDLIIPVEHHANEVPFNSAKTDNSILSGHSNDVAKEHDTNPPTGTPELESSETQNEDFSESNDINKASEKEDDSDDFISRFSRTSEKYATDETVVDNEASTTETQPTVSSYVMDAEAETSYLDDSTDNYKENTKHQSITYSPSSGQTIVFESDNNQTPSDSEEEELVGKEFQNGPEKGGEWFEPTVPVLSAINVHKINDKTETSADVQTTVKYSTPTDFKEEVTIKSGETSVFVTDMVDQTQKSLDNSQSSTLLDNQFGKPTITTLNARDFTNNIDEVVIRTTSTKEEPSLTSVSYETTHVEVTDDIEHKANSHQFFHSSGPDTDQNANIPTTEEPHENEATFIGDETTGSSYDIQTTTDKTNSISHDDEIESVPASEAEHRGVPKDVELREQKEIKGEPINSSQHEIYNAGSETTKESDISRNDFMLSDGAGSIMRFTDIITDGSDLITDYVSTTESGTPDEDEDLGKGTETTSSQSEEFYTNLEPITNDEVLYVKGSSEENVENESQLSTTTEVNNNRFKESEELSSEGGHFFEKSTENSVSLGHRTDGLQHKNDDDYSTEHFSTSYYKSTTPLPLLLLNEFVEKVKGDSLLNQNSQSSENHFSTIQPDEITEVLSELVSDEKTEEDTEIRSHDNSETGVTNDHEVTTTQRNSNEHDSVSTQASQEKQTEIYSSSSQSVEYTSQNSYPTENVHFDHSLDETVKVPDSTASSQVTESNTKSEKNVSRLFFIRRSHDDYPSDTENPQNKEETTVEKDSIIYSVKSPAISVKNPDDTDEQEHDEVSVTNEEITQKDEGSTDDAHDSDFHDNGLDATSTSRRSVEPTSTVDTKLEENTSSGSSSDEKFHSESTDATQNNEDEVLEDERENVSGPVTTPEPMNSDTTWNI